jgi:hypothetical protein
MDAAAMAAASGSNSAEPPPFTPGSFSDPVVEKAAAHAQTIAAYHQRDASRDAEKMEMGYGAGSRSGIGVAQ